MKHATFCIGMVLVAVSATAGAQRGGRPADTVTGPIVIKTFKLAYMKPNVAQSILTPYAGSGVSVNGDLMTVRTSPDRMAQIEKVLADYDRAPSVVSLTFELIAADTTPSRDPALAGLDSVLRGVLRFSGYKLVGRALGSANEGASFTGNLSAGTASDQAVGPLELIARVLRVHEDGARSTVDLDVQLMRRGGSTPGRGPPAETVTAAEITVPVGQTVILGTSTSWPGGALILTVRPQLLAPPGGRG